MVLHQKPPCDCEVKTLANYLPSPSETLKNAAQTRNNESSLSRHNIYNSICFTFQLHDSTQHKCQMLTDKSTYFMQITGDCGSLLVTKTITTPSLWPLSPCNSQQPVTNQLGNADFPSNWESQMISDWGLRKAMESSTMADQFIYILQIQLSVYGHGRAGSHIAKFKLLLILTVLLLVEVSSFNQQLNLRTGQDQLYSQSVGNEAVLLSLVCVADFEMSVQDVILFS